MLKAQVIGNLGKDAVLNTVSGKNVINFTVAHTEQYKDAQGNQKEKTIWVDCGYWTEKTGIAPYLKKGTQVYVEGQPDIRVWEKDGKSGAALTLKVLQVQLLGGGAKQEHTSTPQASNNQAVSDAEVIDELPF